MVTVAQGVSPEAGVDTSEFKDVTWVPLNMRASDFVTLMYGGLYKTGTIDALPGIVYLHDGNPGSATPYRLAGKRRTKMILQYEADLLDLEIVQKYGRKVLKAGFFEFGDAATVTALQQGERVMIEPDGLNVARTVTTGGHFNSTVPRRRAHRDLCAQRGHRLRQPVRRNAGRGDRAGVGRAVHRQRGDGIRGKSQLVPRTGAENRGFLRSHAGIRISIRTAEPRQSKLIEEEKVPVDGSATLYTIVLRE